MSGNILAYIGIIVRNNILVLIANVDMSKDKQANTAASISETEVCLACHRRFGILDLKKHIKSAHKHIDLVYTQDKIVKFSSINVLHGVIAAAQEKSIRP